MLTLIVILVLNESEALPPFLAILHKSLNGIHREAIFVVGVVKTDEKVLLLESESLLGSGT